MLWVLKFLLAESFLPGSGTQESQPNKPTALPCSPQSISTLICDKLSLALAKLWSFIPAATNPRVAHVGEQL